MDRIGAVSSQELYEKLMFQDNAEPLMEQVTPVKAFTEAFAKREKSRVEVQSPDSPRVLLFATAETVQQCSGYLQVALKGYGLPYKANFLSQAPDDVAGVLNSVHGVIQLLQTTQELKEKVELDLKKARVEVLNGEKNVVRLESQLDAKEKEIGNLLMKNRQLESTAKERSQRVAREADDLSKKLLEWQRRDIQFQHEIRRKELEYVRLQDQLRSYFAEKKREAKANLEIAGMFQQEVAQQAGRKTLVKLDQEEVYRRIIQAYETKKADLMQENESLKCSLADLEREHKALLNQESRIAIRTAASSKAGSRAGSPAPCRTEGSSVPMPRISDTESLGHDAVTEVAHLASMTETELRQHIEGRFAALKQNARQLLSGPLSRTEEPRTPQEKRLQTELMAARAAIAEFEQTLSLSVAALSSASTSRGLQQQKSNGGSVRQQNSTLEQDTQGLEAKKVAELEARSAHEATREAMCAVASQDAQISLLQAQVRDAADRLAEAEAEVKLLTGMAGLIQQSHDAAEAPFDTQVAHLTAAEARKVIEQSIRTSKQEQQLLRNQLQELQAKNAELAAAVASLQHQLAIAQGIELEALHAREAALKLEQDREEFERERRALESTLHMWAPGFGAGHFLSKGLARQATAEAVALSEAGDGAGPHSCNGKASMPASREPSASSRASSIASLGYERTSSTGSARSKDRFRRPHHSNLSQSLPMQQMHSDPTDSVDAHGQHPG